MGLAGEDGHGSRTEIAGQRVHEGDEIGFFLVGEPERLHQVGTAGTLDAALIVVFDHRFQRVERTVMHVGASARDLAQARRLEGMLHLDHARHELAATDILCCLLPLTPDTTGILNYELFRKLRRKLEGGPVIINAARGGHQIETDIVRALSDGTLGAASLDVFQTEPLSPESPLWALDNAYLTPHIAAISNIEAGVRYFSQIIRDHEAGKPLPNVVDPGRGY